MVLKKKKVGRPSVSTKTKKEPVGPPSTGRSKQNRMSWKPSGWSWKRITPLGAPATL